ncbi:MAG TPA: hypothetical protein DC064_13860, partial [Cyanobacteria bacterium UBA9273]|nr:hypothetical protein [Cyanobacteria bacterium UBA9273]
RKRGRMSLADTFEDVTVLFADIVGFTELSAWLPSRLIQQGNQIPKTVFLIFDFSLESLLYCCF